MNKGTGRYMIPVSNTSWSTAEKIHQLIAEGHSVKETADILGIKYCEIRSKKEEERA